MICCHVFIGHATFRTFTCTGWKKNNIGIFGFNKGLSLFWQQLPQPKVFCCCRADLRNRRKECWHITFYKTASVEQFSWDVRCKLFSFGTATARKLGLRLGLWLGHSIRCIFFCWSHLVVWCNYVCPCCMTYRLLTFNWHSDVFM